MTVNLLTIDNGFVAGLGTTPSPSKAQKTKDTDTFAAKLAHSSPSADTTETTEKVPELDKAPLQTTTDNNPINPPKEPGDEPPQLPQPTLDEKIATETPSDVQTSQKSEMKCPINSGLDAQSDLAQLELTQSLLTAVPGEKTAAKVSVKSQVLAQSAQAFTSLKPCELTSGAPETASPAVAKIFLTSDQGQIKLEAVLTDTTKAPPAADAEQAKGQTLDKTLTLTPALDKTIIAATKVSKQAAGEQLIAQMTTAGKETAVAEKQGISREVVPEATNADNKTTTTGEKPAIQSTSNTSDSQKTTVLQMVSVKTEGQNPDSGDTKNSPLPRADIPLGPGTPAESKTDTGRQTHPATQQLLASSPESSDKSSMPSNTQSGDVLAQNLDPARIYVSTGQTKDRAGSTSSNSSNSNFEQILSHSNVQSPITQQTSASAQTAAKAASNTYPGEASATINEQILQSIHSSLQQGQQQITIRLNPPELGKVFIRFNQQQDQITGLLQVDKPETRAEIQHALPQIIQNLNNSGIQIKRLDVVLTDQQQQAGKDQSLQDGAFQQQGSANSNTMRNNPDVAANNDWLSNDNNYAGLHELQEMLVTDNSINILI